MKIRNRVRKIRLENFNYGDVIPKRTMEARDADIFLLLIDTALPRRKIRQKT